MTGSGTQSTPPCPLRRCLQSKRQNSTNKSTIERPLVTNARVHITPPTPSVVGNMLVGQVVRESVVSGKQACNDVRDQLARSQSTNAAACMQTRLWCYIHALRKTRIPSTVWAKGSTRSRTHTTSAARMMSTAPLYPRACSLVGPHEARPDNSQKGTGDIVRAMLE